MADFSMLQSTYKHHLSIESQGPYHLWKLPTSRRWRPVSITESAPQTRANSYPLLAIQPGMPKLERCLVSHTGHLSTPILNPLEPIGYPRCESTVPPVLHTCILIFRVWSLCSKTSLSLSTPTLSVHAHDEKPKPLLAR